MLTDFKERLIRGEVFIGAFICLPSPESAEIFAELGFDWLIINTEHGPYDLSASMGKPGQIKHPDVQAAVRSVRDVVLNAGLKLGIYCSDPESARNFVEQGHTLIGIGTDLNFLVTSASTALASAKK